MVKIQVLFMEEMVEKWPNGSFWAYHLLYGFKALVDVVWIINLREEESEVLPLTA